MWSNLGDFLVGILQEQKINMAIVVAGLMAFSWMNTTFITKVDASDSLNEMNRTVVVSIKAIESSVIRMEENQAQHVKEYRIEAAISECERIESDLWHLTLHEQQHGVSAETESLRRQLTESQRHAETYRNCLLNDLPNCKHLASLRR